MTNSFNIDRFWQFFKLNWYTQHRLPYILLCLSALISILILSFFAKEAQVGMYAEPPMLIFLFSFVSLGWIYASLSFSDFSEKGNAIRFLQLPVSAEEKWLVKFVMAVLVFPLIIIVTMQGVFWLFNLVAPALFAVRFQALPWTSLQMLSIFYLYYLVLPLSFCAGLFWKKYGALKTLVAALAVTILLMVIMRLWSEAPKEGYSFLELSLAFQGSNAPVEMQPYIDWFWYGAAIIPSFLLLVASYFFIKEREL